MKGERERDRERNGEGEAKRCCGNRVGGARGGGGACGGAAGLKREDAGEVQAREEVLRQRVGMQGVVNLLL